MILSLTRRFATSPFDFYDVRTFGAVMTTFVKNSLNCGQVRGLAY